MSIIDALSNQSATKRTENGAMAYSTLGNPITDLFAQIGALRPRSELEIEAKFEAAFNLDPNMALRMFLYAGDIREGLGERRTFRTILEWLAEEYPTVTKGLVPYIGEYNRFDSLFVLVDTPVEDEMWSYVAWRLSEDMKALAINNFSNVSLLAKWMPSENASSVKTRYLAKRAYMALGLSPRMYRKMLSKIRKFLHVVECDMSAGNWNLNFSAVPARAMLNYRNAFMNHNPEGFQKYIDALQKGKTKINASVLYPYNLVSKYAANRYSIRSTIDPIVEEQWKALPNYITGHNNILVMADVSGSMTGRPMETSVGLGIYFAEHNEGLFHNKLITFTDEPDFISLDFERTLCDKVAAVMGRVGYSTNLEAAFNLVLTAAVNNHVNPVDMPTAIVVISDMEIDSPYYKDLDFIAQMRRTYGMFGYELPKLVMWNVEARNDTFLSREEGIINVSGQSTITFKSLLRCLNGENVDVVRDTLMVERYDIVDDLV